MGIGEIVGVIIILFIILFPMVRYRMEQAQRKGDPAAYDKQQQARREDFQKFLHSIEGTDEDVAPPHKPHRTAAMRIARPTPPPPAAPSKGRTGTFYDDLRTASTISSTLVKKPIKTEGLKMKSAPLLTSPLSCVQPPITHEEAIPRSALRGTRLSPRSLILGQEILQPPLALRAPKEWV